VPRAARQADPELAGALLGEDTKLMQDTLKKARTAPAHTTASLHTRAPPRRHAKNMLRAQRALKRAHAPAHTRAPLQLHASLEREGELDASFAMSSMERMRARCTVPRDVVMVYESLNKVGLQYGPAFRLLTDVYVPEAVAASQSAAHAAGHA
jgi:hypothetical protein